MHAINTYDGIAKLLQNHQGLFSSKIVPGNFNFCKVLVRRIQLINPKVHNDFDPIVQGSYSRDSYVPGTRLPQLLNNCTVLKLAQIIFFWQTESFKDD